MLLAEAANGAQQGPLADFHLEGEEAWREFRIGAWLHDCGKVTTPEYVVDKATKLETNYNRIHEVRTSFEVLLRDARIAQLEGQLAGGDATALQQSYDATAAALQEEFRFVAESNEGANFLGRSRWSACSR
jgi:ABC-type phosphate transport system auxiliary subunit